MSSAPGGSSYHIASTLPQDKRQSEVIRISTASTVVLPLQSSSLYMQAAVQMPLDCGPTMSSIATSTPCVHSRCVVL
jgi:hypothetical protein